ncbi:MAG: hypothetical protein LBU87_01640 [Lactobacillales bacterium]|nr:hypothetical protein [Lactobacillales bacterium]
MNTNHNTQEDTLRDYEEQLMLVDASYANFNIPRDGDYLKELKKQLIEDRGFSKQRADYVIDNYDIVQHTDPESGASFCVFSRKDQPDAPKILAVRGTEIGDLNDINEDHDMIRYGIPASQARFIRQKIYNDLPRAQYKLVGHSLGGGIVETLNIVLPKDIVVSVLGYNSSGIDTDTHEAHLYFQSILGDGWKLNHPIDKSKVKNIVAGHGKSVVTSLHKLDNVIKIPGHKHDAKYGWDAIHTLRNLGIKSEEGINRYMKTHTQKDFNRDRETVKGVGNIYYEPAFYERWIGYDPNTKPLEHADQMNAFDWTLKLATAGLYPISQSGVNLGIAAVRNISRLQDKIDRSKKVYKQAVHRNLRNSILSGTSSEMPKNFSEMWQDRMDEHLPKAFHSEPYTVFLDDLFKSDPEVFMSNAQRAKIAANPAQNTPMANQPAQWMQDNLMASVMDKKSAVYGSDFVPFAPPPSAMPKIDPYKSPDNGVGANAYATPKMPVTYENLTPGSNDNWIMDQMIDAQMHDDPELRAMIDQTMSNRERNKATGANSGHFLNPFAANAAKWAAEEEQERARAAAITPPRRAPILFNK